MHDSVMLVNVFTQLLKKKKKRRKRSTSFIHSVSKLFPVRLHDSFTRTTAERNKAICYFPGLFKVFCDPTLFGGGGDERISFSDSEYIFPLLFFLFCFLIVKESSQIL